MDELTLKSIELIFKLVPMLKSWTGERRREYFDKLLSPLHVQLQSTHEFYCQTMLETRDAIVRSDGGNGMLGLSNEEESPEARKKHELILQEFLRKRMTDEHLRDVLRNQAQAFLMRVKWKEERRFLVLVCFYFLQRSGISFSDEVLDEEAEQVIHEGGIRHWDTPATWTYELMRKAQSGQELLTVLDEARHDLNQRYMNAQLAFARVKSTIVLDN